MGVVEIFDRNDKVTVLELNGYEIKEEELFHSIYEVKYKQLVVYLNGVRCIETMENKYDAQVDKLFYKMLGDMLLEKMVEKNKLVKI